MMNATEQLIRERILAMPSGRELDALVAERVMGWRPAPPYGAYVDADDFPTGFSHAPGLHEHDLRNWKPSTDIAAAWQVVEKMYSQGMYAEINCHPFGKPFRCGFDYGAGGRKMHALGWGETAPLAICRAALLVVEKP